ncbi:MAG: CBS domain-containing protein [Desulfobacteraceae bacterium]|nr:CBS domain-containing protein [Desulfobacteraceae bacterium]MBC2756864.1 CBS domain-containing protein [Desulfobacteraceae bacterium]
MKTAQDILNEKKAPKMVTISEDTTIYEAIAFMVKNKIGAMLINKGDDIKGIWTERDYLRNTMEPGFNPKAARIGDYMNTDLISAPHDTTIIKLQEKFLGLFIRHILIKKKKKYIGMLSVGDVVRANLLAKDDEIRNLNKIASWEYYENWSWRRKTNPK